MNIIIPLGGKGERFKQEGYLEPKPLIKVLDKEILFHVLDNLNFDNNDKIFIIYNNELDEYNFDKILLNKYPFIKLIKLNKQTKGASETISIGIDYIINNFEYNIKTILIDGDTFYTENIINYFRNINDNAIYYIKNYETNPIYSYIKLDESNKVLEIKEKNKISDNANTGAYAFNNINILLKFAKYIINNNICFKNEPYTSCIIDEMIKNNEIFRGIELNNDSVHVLGTPKQVNEFIKNINNHHYLHSK